MEMSKGNSLYSYLLKNVFFFSFKKIGEQESRTGPVWDTGTSGRGVYKEMV
jgi:hypothetical protein